MNKLMVYGAIVYALVLGIWLYHRAGHASNLEAIALSGCVYAGVLVFGPYFFSRLASRCAIQR